ncbi:hypothetical protein LJR219_003780 [Phenylobacterium sp. LjRoot219]|uniref:hypothetical protein n=1 Tax=Phenylobacterium sp. LjRoot219 TaxID=3342283 RepID=UPI003ECD6AB0
MVHLLVLPPMGVAAFSLWVEAWIGGRVSPGTIVFAAVMLAIAGFGLVHAMTPTTLVADQEGIRWRRGAKTQFFGWSDVEEIGVARPKGMEGWDAPLPRALTGMRRSEIRRLSEPEIGLNLVAAKSPFPDPGTRAYQMGFTGYEVNLPNDFGLPIEAIVDELRSRWLSHRQASAQTGSR